MAILSHTIAVLWSAVLVVHAASPPMPPADKPAAPIEFNIALEDGKLRLSELLGPIQERVPALQSAAGDLTLNLTRAIDQLKLRQLEEMTDGAITIDVHPNNLHVRIDRNRISQQIQAAIDHLKSSDAPPKAASMYGIRMVEDPRGFVPTDSARTVLLVHGLDEMGFMWNDVVPALHAAGYRLATFEYPNDGPIAASADLLAKELARLRRDGVMHVDVVSHSMGGLVVRDVLTRRSLYAGDGAGAERYPAIDRFIMIAPPNQGAMMARFRPVIGLSEQVYRLFQGENVVERSAADGNGEAAQDLLPGSAFLRELNQRPLPTHTRMTIIAGQIAGFDRAALHQWLAKVKSSSEQTSEIERSLNDAAEGLGDGCVSIESARLKGVDDFVIARGNHVSILKSFELRPSVPPAIPILLDRLRQDVVAD